MLKHDMLTRLPCVQVQRQVLSSFLDRSWQTEQQQQQQSVACGSMRLADVPQGFVLHSLLPAAGQAHMWRGEGAAELQQRLASWVGCYYAAQALAGPQRAQHLLLGLLSKLETGAGSVQQRPFLQTLASALLAAAEAAPAVDASGGDAAWQLLFLQRLRQATCRLSGHWGSPNSSHARSTCRSLLAAASAVVALPGDLPAQGGSGSSVDVQQLLAAAAVWLQELPLVLLLPGGELHRAAAAWVGAAGWQRVLPLLAGLVLVHMDGDPLAPGEHAAEAGGDRHQASDGWTEWQRQAAGLACLAMLLASGSDGATAGGPAAATQPSADELAAAFVDWSEVLGVLYRR